MEPKELLHYARRIAFKIWKDSEAEDAAVSATMRCMSTYDASTGVPEKRWLAILVKQAIIHRWRKRKRLERIPDFWWEFVVEQPPIECEESTADYVLLYEHYIDRWPLDVIAHRRAWSVPETRKRMNAAKSRFIQEHR